MMNGSENPIRAEMSRTSFGSITTLFGKTFLVALLSIYKDVLLTGNQTSALHCFYWIIQSEFVSGFKISNYNNNIVVGLFSFKIYSFGGCKLAKRGLLCYAKA